MIDKKELKFVFDRGIYDVEPVYITSDLFWDGGVDIDSSLLDKYKFYQLSKKMSDIIKEIVVEFQENIYVAECLCENIKMYAQWSDLKKNKLFQTISRNFKKNKYYMLSLPEDNILVDNIIESNFMYLTHISLYLPKSEIIIQPTCHTEIIIYSNNRERLINVLLDLIKNEKGLKIVR